MERLKERIEYYQKTLTRKQNLVKPLHDKRNKLEDLTNNEYCNMLVLEAEIQQVIEFMEDLKYIEEEEIKINNEEALLLGATKILTNDISKETGLNEKESCQVLQNILLGGTVKEIVMDRVRDKDYVRNLFMNVNKKSNK